MTKKVLLAKFNRDYHSHDVLGDKFREAFEHFCEEVMLWQAQTGINFKCDIVEEKDIRLMCTVTGVVATFESETDYALYKLQMPTNMRATDIKHIDNKWQFTGWRTFETQSV